MFVSCMQISHYSVMAFSTIRKSLTKFYYFNTSIKKIIVSPSNHAVWEIFVSRNAVYDCNFSLFLLDSESTNLTFWTASARFKLKNATTTSSHHQTSFFKVDPKQSDKWKNKERNKCIPLYWEREALELPQKLNCR